MSPDTPRSDRPAAPSGDKYLDAIHEVSEREKGAHAPDGEVEPPKRRPRAEDESSDPVGDGHSDDDFARRESRVRP